MISEKLRVSLSIIAIFCFVETSFASGLHFGIIDAIEDKIDELREENNDVIPGPDGPSGEDQDSAFRSLTVHPHSSDIILMGTERNGFVFSSDGGRTWSRKRRGLEYSDGLYPEIWDIAFDPLDPSNVYAATLDSPGPATGNYPSSKAGLYKSVDGGETWTQMNTGLPNSRVNSVQVSGANPNTVIIGLEGGTATFSGLQGEYFEGGIYRSTDGASTFSKVPVADNDVKNGYWRIAPYGDSGDEFITFGMNYSNLPENLGFLRSRDSGASWNPFGEPLKSLLIHSFDLSKDGQIIYANERDSYLIQKSVDAGATWDTTSINQANGPIAVSPVNSELVLYAGASRLYRSSDGLESYQAVLETDATISDIVLAPSAPNVVYLVADGYLLYKSTDGGVSFEFLLNIRSDVLNK